MREEKGDRVLPLGGLRLPHGELHGPTVPPDNQQLHIHGAVVSAV